MSIRHAISRLGRWVQGNRRPMPAPDPVRSGVLDCWERDGDSSLDLMAFPGWAALPEAERPAARVGELRQFVLCERPNGGRPATD